MKFVADENVDLPILARLRNSGHEVYAVAEMSAGVSDDEVLKQANQQGVVLLTGVRISANWFIGIKNIRTALC